MGTLRAGARLWWVVGWELLGTAAWALHCRQLGGQAGRDTSGSVVGGITACLGRLFGHWRMCRTVWGWQGTLGLGSVSPVLSHLASGCFSSSGLAEPPSGFQV